MIGKTEKCLTLRSSFISKLTPSSGLHVTIDPQCGEGGANVYSHVEANKY